MAIEHILYPSIAAMREAVFAPLNRIGNREIFESAITNKDPSREDWLGVLGGTEAVKKLVGDTFEPAEKLMRDFHTRMGAKIPRAIGVNRAIVRGDNGDSLDYHAMLRGNNDRAWVSSKRQLKRGHGIVRLVVDIGGNSGTSSDILKWRGVAGLTLAETLTKAGYSVEIVAGFAVKGHKKKHHGDIATMCCVVKPRNGAVNYGILSSTIGLPGFFRVYGFAAIIKNADNNKTACEDNLGHIQALSAVLPVPEKVTQFIVPSDVCNERSAEKWAKETVKLLQLTGV